MRPWRTLVALVTLLAACDGAPRTGGTDRAAPSALAAKDVRSGTTFLTPDTQALQADEFANPGSLWTDRGRDLFGAAQGDGPACAACHADANASLAGAAARYPAIDGASGAMVNIEGRINLCRQRHQGQDPFQYESEDLLALTTYVASLSRGVPHRVAETAETRPYFEQGQDYFFTRRGQLNLACSQCHNENWGKQLRGDTISQGHGNGFPAYRFEWQTLGSLHRRFHDCDAGVRAEPRPSGSDDYVALEYYLAVRAGGLPVETPAIRR